MFTKQTTVNPIALRVAASEVSEAKRTLSRHVDELADHAIECTSCGARLELALGVQRVLEGDHGVSPAAIVDATSLLLNIVVCHTCHEVSRAVDGEHKTRLCGHCHSDAITPYPMPLMSH